MKILQKLDGTGAIKLGLVGVLVSLVNVKNLALFIAAVEPLVALERPVVEKVPLVWVCVLIFTSAIGSPILIFALGRARVQPLLARLRAALERNRRRVTLIVLPLFAALFFWRGLGG